MAETSYDLTTYYAKRIIGDTAANTAASALLQSGVDSSMWIFGHNRSNYGIRYVYNTGTKDTQDCIDFHGGNASTATVSIRLDTGDITSSGDLSIAGTSTLSDIVAIKTNTDSNYSLKVNGNSYIEGTLTIKGTNGTSIIETTTNATNTGKVWSIPNVGANRYFVGSSSNTFTKNGVIYANETTSITSTSAGANGAVLIGKGSSAIPTWVAAASGALYATEANGTPQFGKLPVAQGGTNATSFTDGCVIIPSTTNSVQSFGSTGLKIAGAVNANITLSPNKAGQTMTISSTTGAMTISTTTATLGISSTTGAMTIGTTTGAITIQTNGASGGNIIIKNANAGTISIQSVKSSIALSAATTIAIESTTSTSITATTTLSIKGMQGTTITSGTNYATVFKINTTEYGEFNKNGMFQLNDTGTQDTHKLYVNGDSAFNGKIAFGEQTNNVISTNAYLVWNNTDQSIDFVFT